MIIVDNRNGKSNKRYNRRLEESNRLLFLNFSFMRTAHLGILLFLCFFCSVSSQGSFRIHIIDQNGEGLAYPEIRIPYKIHRMGTINGELFLNKDILSKGDSIFVRHIGYEPKVVVIDNEMLLNGGVSILLAEKTFILDELVVTADGFDAEALFRRRLRDFLLPRYRRLELNVEFDFQFAGEATKTGTATITIRRSNVEDITDIVLSAPTEHKEQLIGTIKRASELNFTFANIFCSRINRREYFSHYLGVINNLSVWEFTMRPRENMRWGVNKKDTSRSLVYLDNDGIIVRIETQFTHHLENSVSYLLDTEYTLLGRRLVAYRTTKRVIPNADNDEFPELTINIRYSLPNE